MTIDERLDRVTERHEALVQWLELSSHEWDRRYAEQGKRMDDLAARVDDVAQFIRQVSRSIDTLGRIAELYEHRLDSLEDAS